LWDGKDDRVEAAGTGAGVGATAGTTIGVLTWEDPDAVRQLGFLIVSARRRSNAHALAIQLDLRSHHSRYECVSALTYHF
jgi:hypothetical protein